jgi:hypothetical protein
VSASEGHEHGRLEGVAGDASPDWLVLRVCWNREIRLARRIEALTLDVSCPALRTRGGGHPTRLVFPGRVFVRGPLSPQGRFGLIRLDGVVDVHDAAVADSALTTLRRLIEADAAAGPVLPAMAGEAIQLRVRGLLIAAKRRDDAVLALPFGVLGDVPLDRLE